MSSIEDIFVNEIAAAERIAVPKGENNAAFRNNFECCTDIEIPTPLPGKLSAKSNGKQFFWVRGLDIPAITDSKIVDVGLTGTDGLFEYEGFDNLRYLTAGSKVCRFSALTPPDKAESFRDAFLRTERRFLVPMLRLPTSRPRALERVSEWRDLPFRACGLKIGGCVEAYAEMLGVSAVADIVKTGATAEANGLTEAMGLFDISAEILMRSQERSRRYEN